MWAVYELIIPPLDEFSLSILYLALKVSLSQNDQGTIATQR